MFWCKVETEKRQVGLLSKYLDVLCPKYLCCSLNDNIVCKDGRWRVRPKVGGHASSTGGAPGPRWNVPGGISLKVAGVDEDRG